MDYPNKPSYFVWVVAYIDVAFLPKVEQQLKKYPEYAEIEAYIPTVKILKKTTKGEQVFDEVPLLFNYGFFKIPRRYASQAKYLEKLQKDVSCIYAWVRDSLKVMREKPKIGEKMESIFKDNDISVATASAEEVSRLVNEIFAYSAHSSADLAGVNAGDKIILRNYPWEGIEAKIIKIDPKKEQVTVEINIFDSIKPIDLSFDHIFFTIYHKRDNYDDSITVTKSLDEMMQNNSDGKLYKKQYDKDQTK